MEIQNIIREGIDSSNDFTNSLVHITLVYMMLRDKQDNYFKKKLCGQKLIDLGSGSELEVPAHIVGLYQIKTYSMVDLFLHVKSLDLSDEFEQDFEFVREDALSHMLRQPDNSGNVMTNAIDYALIRSDEYLKCLAHEIYRVVPSGGIYIVHDCPTLSEVARTLFPIKHGDDYSFFNYYEK